MNNAVITAGVPVAAPRQARASVRVWLFAAAALAVMVAGFWVRASHMSHPMRNDESFTDIAYVQTGDYFNYSRPNNHVLNTLLMAASTNLAGNFPAALRFPAFLCGLMLIPAIGLLCFQLSRSMAGALAAMALAASSTALVEYSVNARGYSLVALASVVMASLTVQLRETPRWRNGWVLWVLCGVAGLYTIPVMVYSIAPVVLLFLLDRQVVVKERLRPLIVSLVVMGAITAALYAPVVHQSGIAAINANPFVVPEAPGALLKDFADTSRDGARIWGGDASFLFVPFLCAGTLLCALPGAWRGRNHPILLALIGIVIAVVLALLQRRVAPVRVFLYMQAWMIACACAATALLAGRIPRWAGQLRGVLAGVLLLVAAGNYAAVERQPLMISEDPHTYTEARDVAVDLIKWGADRPDVAILWNPFKNLWPPFLYYFVQLHVGHVYPLSWRDDRCETVFMLLGKDDDVQNLVGHEPAFHRLYGEPKLMEVTANSRIYEAHRL